MINIFLFPQLLILPSFFLGGLNSMVLPFFFIITFQFFIYVQTKIINFKEVSIFESCCQYFYLPFVSLFFLKNNYSFLPYLGLIVFIEWIFFAYPMRTTFYKIFHQVFLSLSFFICGLFYTLNLEFIFIIWILIGILSLFYFLDKKVNKMYFKVDAECDLNIIVKQSFNYVTLFFKNKKGVFTEACSNMLNKKELPVIYIRLMTMVFFFVNTNVKNVLNIGLGGGAFPEYLKTYYPESNITSVEISPVVTEIANDYFKTDHKIIVADGFNYIENDNNYYDIISVDCFKGGFMPSNLISNTFFSNISRRLSSNGAMVINLHRGKNYNKILKNIKAHFKKVVLFKMDFFGNIILVAYNFDKVDIEKAFKTQKEKKFKYNIILGYKYFKWSK